MSVLRVVVALFVVFGCCHAATAPSPSAVALQRAVSQAIATSSPQFVFPSGEYVFGSTPLNITGAKDMKFLVAGPVTLWFDIGGGVRFQACSNVTFDGAGSFVIDYDPLPYIQMTVVSDVVSGPSTMNMLVSADAGSPEVWNFWNTYKWGGPSADEYPRGPIWWDGGNGTAFPLHLAQGTRNDRSFDADTRLQNTSTPGVYNYTTPTVHGQTPPSKGDKFTVSIRVGFTWLLRQCDHILSANVTIHGASYMAITEFDGRGSNVYDGMRVVRRSASSPNDASCGPHKNRTCLGLMAANADLFHSSGCQRGPVVKNSELSFADDDYFNVHSRVQVSAGVYDERQLLVLDPRLGRDFRVPDDNPYGTVETMPNVVPGFKLSFHEISRLTTISSVTVDTVTRVPASDLALIQKAETLCQTLNTVTNHPVPPFGNLSIYGAGTAPRVWLVTIKEPLASLPTAITAGITLLTVDDWPNDGAVLTNNYLHGGEDGVRWKSSNGVVTGNRWANALSNPNTGLEVTPLRSYLEGPLVITNVTITGNEFEGVPKGPAGGLIRVCHGIGQKADPVFATCSGVVVDDNTWPQSQ